MNTDIIATALFHHPFLISAPIPFCARQLSYPIIHRHSRPERFDVFCILRGRVFFPTTQTKNTENTQRSCEGCVSAPFLFSEGLNPQTAPNTFFFPLTALSPSSRPQTNRSRALLKKERTHKSHHQSGTRTDTDTKHINHNEESKDV